MTGTGTRKTAFITGCSSGTGKAAAKAFREADWNVVATMRNPAAWNDDAADDRLHLLPLDVTDPVSIDSALDGAISRFGKLDLIVNNAGMGLFSVFEATPDELLRRVYETNVFGPMRVIKAILPHFHEQGGGRIVTVTSSSAYMPDGLMSIYGSSKAALDNFVEGLRFELLPQNVQLKLIESGFLPNTRFTEQIQATAVGLEIPAAYGAYFQQRVDYFASAGQENIFATDSDVAAAILAAAEDESGQLRWVVGEDAKHAAHMRWETSEREWSAWQLERCAPR